MRITIIGTGYVGLVTACCLADIGHDVVGVDIDAAKVAKLKEGTSPIYEPGLEELLSKVIASGNISFTTNLEEALPETEVIFSAVATPAKEDFSADLRAVLVVCESVASLADHPLVFVNKSTVPVGTGKECEMRMDTILAERGVEFRIPVVSNPEFLREGCAIGDTMHPDRIVIGSSNTSAIETLKNVYKGQEPILVMERESAEIVKYASNAFLATKISFINQLAELCESQGGSITDVATGMGLDDRIGSKFLRSGIGYGGSCFPKDVKALIALSRHTGIPMPIISAVHDVNDRARQRFAKRVLEHMNEGQTVGVWGLAFKPGTDDMRDAPSIDIIADLQQSGITVRAYDPIAQENAKEILEGVEFCNSPLEAVEGVDALAVLTEWEEFAEADLSEIASNMAGTDVFDGRNCLDKVAAESVGLRYHGVGLYLSS